MDLITGNIRLLYRKYLLASVASAMVMSIYSFVDTIAVGQSEGPMGAAAMAVITPLFGILVFLAILCGVGGSVLMGNARGEGDEEKGNVYFTASLALTCLLTAFVWLALLLFPEEFLAFFGADPTVLPKAMEYSRWIIWFFPAFIAPIVLSSFLRNDGAPGLAMAAVIAGGCLNMLGDYYFVFPLGMGMTGAAIATVLGTSVQVLVMAAHFFRKGCRLRLVRCPGLFRIFREILTVGFGASVLDLGTVVLAILMNNQIMRYGDTTALAVYGVVATIASLFQALFCGVGQAIQPIVSVNCGAKQPERIRAVWRMSLGTVLVMGIVFTAVGMIFPEEIVGLFVAATPEIFTAAPGVVRPCFTLFLCLGITVLSTYYLQSVMHNGMSMAIALMRSVLVSGLLLVLLPLFLDILGVWIAMPAAELIVAVAALIYIRKRI